MPRYLALEWDSRIARLAVAELAGGRAVLEKAVTFPFPVAAEGDVAFTNASRIDALAKQIIELGWNKLDATVCIGRSLLEIRTLQVPPVPADELPDLVRFQATRSFSNMTDDSPVDFIPLADAADGGKILLAAALPMQVLADVKRLVDKAGVRLNHLVCRPFAAAELLPESYADGKFRLLVDLLGDEADLTVLAGRDVVFPRSVRLAPEEGASALSRSLVAEIRRTMMAARNQLGGGMAEEIVLLGSSGQQGSIRQALADEFKTSIPVQLLDPLTVLSGGLRAASTLPDSTSAFAPLLGVLSTEAANRAPTIDFLNPRRRPVPISYRPLLIKGSIAAAVLATVAFGYFYWTLSTLSGEIKTLQKQLNEQTKLAEKGKPTLASTAKVDEFVSQDLVLLDELVTLSEKFPASQDARLEDLSVNTGTNGQPISAVLQGGAASDQVISQIEQTLRDSRRTVFGNRAEKKTSIPGYPWTFSAELQFTPELPSEAAPAVPASEANKEGTKKEEAKAPVKVPAAEGAAKEKTPEATGAKL